MSRLWKLWNAPLFHNCDRQILSNMLRDPKFHIDSTFRFYWYLFCCIVLHVRNLVFLYKVKWLYLKDCKFSYLYATLQHCYDCITCCSNGISKSWCMPIHSSSRLCLKNSREHIVSNSHCLGDTESRTLMSSITTNGVTASLNWPKVESEPKVTAPILHTIKPPHSLLVLALKPPHS